MTQDNLIKLSQSGAFSDLLTDVLRNGARAPTRSPMVWRSAFQLQRHSRFTRKAQNESSRLVMTKWPKRCAFTTATPIIWRKAPAVSYTHLRAHETGRNLVCRLLLEKKKT